MKHARRIAGRPGSRKAIFVTDPETGREYAVPQGGDEDDDGEEDDDDDDDDDDGLSDLLEEEDDDDDDDDDGDDGGTGSDDDVDTIVAKAVAQATKKLEKQFDSIADRRVNAILKEIRKGSGKGKGSDGDGASRGGEDDDLHREARIGLREYLNDEIRFLSADERKLAMSLGQMEIAQASGDDADQIAAAAASSVAGQIRSLRKMYEQRTVKALKKRGALKERPGQPGKGGDGVGRESELAKGAEKAKAMGLSTRE